jgi:hypothetical protein
VLLYLKSKTEPACKKVIDAGESPKKENVWMHHTTLSSPYSVEEWV